MIYDLVYTDRAKRDLNTAADFIAQHATETAERWFNGFVAALETLRRDAMVYGLAPESDLCSMEIRQFIYRTSSQRANRALYTVRDANVYVLAIRRPEPDLLAEDDLKQSIAEVE